MYQIAVCDDEAVFAEEVSAQISAIMREKNIPCQVDVYLSCDELYAAFSSGGHPHHIYFLDILMDGMDGMEFARRLRAGDEASTIVFVTCTHRYIKQGYDVRARQYLEKPVDPGELRDILYQDYEKKFQKQFVTIRQGTMLRSIPLEQVVCLEARGRHLLYHLLGEAIAVKSTDKFDTLQDRLPHGFVRCHRSYYLHIDNVVKLRRNEAIAKNSQLIPISRSRYQDVQQAFMEHVRRVSVPLGKS